jgi:hypothetical protein
VAAFDLDLRTVPNRADLRDLKLGLAMSLGSSGLLMRWWLATKMGAFSGEKRPAAGNAEAAGNAGGGMRCEERDRDAAATLDVDADAGLSMLENGVLTSVKKRNASEKLHRWRDDGQDTDTR